jgi:hypothetical protein
MSAVTACEECGFDYDRVDPASFGATVEPAIEDLRLILATQPVPDLEARPAPSVWSAVEYCCHIRDVLLVQRDRLFLALVEDTPSFPRMYRDERVELAGYGSEPVDRIADQLQVATELATVAFGRVDPALWLRPLIYNWPEPRRLDVRWLAAHTAHEVEHHRHDIRKGLEKP